MKKIKPIKNMEYELIKRIVLTRVVSEKLLPYNMAATDTPDACYNFWKNVIEKEPDHESDKENLVVVMLNTRLVPFNWSRVSLGTVDKCEAHPREILRPVIASAASSFIIIHNHPSGDPSPSRADELITRNLVEGAKLMLIPFIDHIIVGEHAPGRLPFYSFKVAGLIP